VSIFVNEYAVRQAPNAVVYTTAKNAVAGVLLLALVLVPARTAPRQPATETPRMLPLVAVALVGGSIPFVLFFEGLARAEATQAAFIQKTLVVWVALLAVPLLRERLLPVHGAAIALLLAGQAWLAGNAGAVVVGTGEAMILAATLLWAVEVVYVRRLLASYGSRSLAAGRMGIGTVFLLAWLAASGRIGRLAGLSLAQWRWVVLTGLLLTAYVALWYAALARAPAVDVTAVLVLGAVVTAVLAGAFDGTAVSIPGVGLVAAGVAAAAYAALRRAPPAEAR